jgi:DHA2 family multidrug resistance protein
VPQVVRGLGLICIYMPANMIALGTLLPDRMRNAAGLYNLTRELGGALGLATIGTVMNDRLHFHWNRLIEDVNWARPVVQQFLETQTGRLETMLSGDPAQAALKLLVGVVQREALVLSYSDLFIVIGVVFVAGVLLMPLARPARAIFSR